LRSSFSSNGHSHEQKKITIGHNLRPGIFIENIYFGLDYGSPRSESDVLSFAMADNTGNALIIKGCFQSYLL